MEVKGGKWVVIIGDAMEKLEPVRDIYFETDGCFDF